jgi:hypothetical protein
MTQAFNLSQLANNLDTSGRLDATDGLTGATPVANGGTGLSTITANNVILGNGTSAVQLVAPSTSGNVLTSNGTTWQSTAPAGGGVTSLNGQTGAITNTTIDTIGSVIVAIPAVSAPASAGTSTTTVNATIAGSTLRYNYTLGDSGSGISSYAKRGDGSNSYSAGGTALSGTWRYMSTGSVYRSTTNPCDGTFICIWYNALLVRVS